MGMCYDDDDGYDDDDENEMYDGYDVLNTCR